jgi:hypothetical protein
MAQSPETFPRVYVAMVEAGEAGGFLDVVLAQIAEFQSRDKELKSKVMTAMLYPAILFVLAMIVLTVMLVFFIPKFQTVFNSFHGHLPLITQIIIGASHAVIHYGFFVAVGWLDCVFGPHLVCLGKRPACLGGIGFACADCRPAQRPVCDGAVLPDAGHDAWRGRAARAKPQCRAPFHRQPDSRGRRLAIHRACAAGRTAWAKALRIAKIFFPDPFWKWSRWQRKAASSTANSSASPA